jgi:hypothetical protein
MIKEDPTQPPRRASAFAIILSAFAGLFGVVMILIAPTAEKPVGHYLFGGFCLSIVVICFTSGKVQRLFGSIVATMVLATTTWYLLSEIGGGPMASGSRSRPSIVNAILAFLAFGVPSAMYLWRARFGVGPEPEESRVGSMFLEIDDEGVHVESQGATHSVPWSELRRVRIVTNSGGPWSEDVFFVLEGQSGSACVVPHDLAVKRQLLEQLQARLDGVRDDKVIEAMGCTSDASFTIWEKSANDAA